MVIRKLFKIYKRNKIYQGDTEIVSPKIPNTNRLSTEKIILTLIVPIVVLIVYNLLLLEIKPFFELKGEMLR